MGSGGVLFAGTNIVWLRERTFSLSSEGADRNCFRRIPRCSPVNINSVSVSSLNCTVAGGRVKLGQTAGRSVGCHFSVDSPYNP